MANTLKKIIVAHVDNSGQKLVKYAALNNSFAHLFELNDSGDLAIGLKSFFDVMEGISLKNDWVREQLKIDVVRHKSLQNDGNDQLIFIICSNDPEVIAHSHKKLTELSNAYARNDKSVHEYLNKTASSQLAYSNLIQWVMNQNLDRILWSNFEEMCISDFDSIGQFMKLYIETLSMLDEYSLFEVYGTNNDEFQFSSTLNDQKRIVLF